MSHDQVLSLIGDIYDAAADVRRWPETLQRIADAFEAQEASISSVGPTAVPWLVAPRSDPAFLQSYAAYYHPLNLFWRHMSRLPVGTVATDRMVMQKDELHGSEFFNDWSRPQGYLTVMGATLLVEDGWRTEFVMPGRKDFGAEHLKLYGALAPHLVRAVQLNQRLAFAELASARTSAALDHLDQGALVVDAQGRVLFANRAAEALFATGDLKLRDQVLRANGETTALHAMIAACAAAEPDAGGHLALPRDNDRLPLALLIMPLRGEVPWLPRLPGAAIIFVSDPHAAAAPDPEHLRTQFGLTRAEAALVVEIVKGDGLQAAAERLGIVAGTARTHLHRVLAKTRTTRQADLVRLVLGARHNVRRD
jgi:DNA-binding CsgD family transcriptional regulator/PAS domain-containing protein